MVGAKTALAPSWSSTITVEAVDVRHGDFLAMDVHQKAVAVAESRCLSTNMLTTRRRKKEEEELGLVTPNAEVHCCLKSTASASTR